MKEALWGSAGPLKEARQPPIQRVRPLTPSLRPAGGSGKLHPHPCRPNQEDGELLQAPGKSVTQAGLWRPSRHRTACSGTCRDLLQGPGAKLAGVRQQTVSCQCRVGWGFNSAPPTKKAHPNLRPAKTSPWAAGPSSSPRAGLLRRRGEQKDRMGAVGRGKGREGRGGLH